MRISRRFRIAERNADRAYAALRIGLAVALAVLTLVLTLPFAGRAAAFAVLLSSGCAYVGWLLPAILLQQAAARHTRQVASGLPEALELLVVCVEAGLSLEDGIDRVASEIGWSQPALAEELALTSADLKILPDRDRAMGNLALRVDVPSVRSVVTSLSQTLRYGTPLAQALRATASELRNDALIRLEERANRLPPLLTLPMMLFIMPTIFLIIGGPAVLRLMDTFGR